MADRFTAFVPGAPATPVEDAMPRPTIPGLPPPTFASAVPRGEGEGWRSFWGPTWSPSLSEVLFKEGGAGDADFRVMLGIAKGLRFAFSDMETGIEGEVGGTGAADVGEVTVVVVIAVVLLEVVAADDVEEAEADSLALAASTSDADGVLNSTGFTRGVAWTLVISFALSQYA